ncbi:LysR family transcriptional regulator [Bordetella sp. LUAb4]|uniref:LysR family transcriptional regulator n=1 Tax=Bordetella sp. LUAb4 TaxID=2843195 RepID=UPI001E3E1DCB|nr:LysR family transcriptional regulator [Bordetella sp. LUAb4]
MELRQLECFVAVAEELHFGRAAARLRMTQPPLSRQVQMLERSLGVTLFERSSRVVTLTAAGRSFLRDARHLLEFSNHAALQARRTATGTAGHVTLGFTAVAAYRLMPAIVTQARRELPDVDIQLREMVSIDLGRLLVAGDLDLVLARHLPRVAGLGHRLLEREPLMLAVPRGWPLARLDSVSLQALDGQPFISYSPNEGKYFHERIAAALGQAGVRPDIVQHASQTHTLLALVRAGLGVGIVPASARELRLDGVHFTDLADCTLRADMYLAWRMPQDNPAVPALLDCVARMPMAATDQSMSVS